MSLGRKLWKVWSAPQDPTVWLGKWDKNTCHDLRSSKEQTVSVGKGKSSGRAYSCVRKRDEFVLPVFEVGERRKWVIKKYMFQLDKGGSKTIHLWAQI